MVILWEIILSEELARIRLRGGYAILAGILMLIGVPVFQLLVLAPTGFVTAVNAIATHQDFGPLLIWAAAHPLESRLYRVLEVIPFLLALGLPGPLRMILWPNQSASGRVAVWSGRIGFALYTLILFIVMFTNAAAASSYVLAQSESARQAIALDYGGCYQLEILLINVLGKIAITVFLLLMSLRLDRTRTMEMWLAFLGIACAALQAATALFFILTPTSITTPTSDLAFITLALWLVATGVLLARIRELPSGT